MQRRGSSRLVAGLGLLALLVGSAVVALLFGLASVRGVEGMPADGAGAVSMTAPIRLVFSQPMEPSSVEARLRVEPGLEGQFLWQGNELLFQPQVALAPDTAYTLTLQAGAMTQRGRPLKEGWISRFRTRSPQLLYLGRSQPGGELRHLFVASLDKGPSRCLTDHAWGVWDYAVHPQGDGMVYSVLRGDGGSDLWHMERDGSDQHLLLACPGAACLNPVWSPDGGTLAYERRDIWAGSPNLDPKAGRIWLFNLDEGEERALFDYDVALHSAAWAPDGKRLAYVSPMLPGLEVYDLGTEALQQFGNEWGVGPVWAPDGAHLVVPELMLAGEAFVVRLVRIDLADEAMVDISGDDDFVKDVSPAWSPGGGWIAFGRQFLDEERATPGRELWLTRPDASEAYPLLVEPMADLFAFAWRPDGASLAYLKADLSEGPQPMPDVSVWVFDLEQREPVLVARDGVLPKWLP
jgi:Tol biopolymer transport system component